MNTLADRAQSAKYEDGFVIIKMQSGLEVRFPVKDNLRLETGIDNELSNIEISPFGLHWPDLDEDLSLRGILAGNNGQRETVKQS